MREIVKLYVTTAFPEFLHAYLDRALYFVDHVKYRFKNHTPEKLLEFAQNMLLGFWMDSGNVEQVGKEVEILIKVLMEEIKK